MKDGRARQILQPRIEPLDMRMPSRPPIRMTPTWLFSIAIFFAVGYATAQERYSLELPGQPDARSIVVRDARGLEIVDSVGERHRYEPRAEYDTDDGRYIGYYSASAKRFLRWPVAGEGRMQVGSRNGDAIQWTFSRMEVRRLGGGPPPKPQPGGGVGPLGGGNPGGNPGGGPIAESGPLAMLGLDDERFVVGRVDGAGQLDLYQLQDGQWSPWRDPPADALLPGATIALTRGSPAGRVRVWTVGPRGELLSWNGGPRWRPVSGPTGADLLPGSSLASFSDDGRDALALVDAQGRLWVGDPDQSDWRCVEERDGVLSPGAMLASLNTPKSRLLVVDRRGNLLEYRGKGKTPRRWGTGFPPAAPIATWEGDTNGGHEWRVALVHNSGHVQQWTGVDDDPGPRRVLRDLRLAPGSPLAIARHGDRMIYSAIAAEGEWLAWAIDGQDVVRDAILAGFRGGGPVIAPANGPFLLAMDRSGQLVATRRLRGAWESALLARQFAFAPRLMQRVVTAEQPLPPAQVLFQNTHNEELVVRLFDRSRPDLPQEIVVPAGKSARVRLERDSATVVVETFLAVVPGGGVREETRTLRIPPASRYTANVWVNRVTSVYFDRTTNKGPDPDEVNQSLVSLGVFPLPPGGDLADGDRINVYREATARRNPGAVRLLEPNPAP